jgi:hypothetical protein
MPLWIWMEVINHWNLISYGKEVFCFFLNLFLLPSSFDVFFFFFV